jgi:hypothetical protein
VHLWSFVIYRVAGIFKTQSIISESLKLINQSSDDFDGAKEIHFLILS